MSLPPHKCSMHVNWRAVHACEVVWGLSEWYQTLALTWWAEGWLVWRSTLVWPRILWIHDTTAVQTQSVYNGHPSTSELQKHSKHISLLSALTLSPTQLHILASTTLLSCHSIADTFRWLPVALLFCSMLPRPHSVSFALFCNMLSKEPRLSNVIRTQTHPPLVLRQSMSAGNPWENLWVCLLMDPDTYAWQILVSPGMTSSDCRYLCGLPVSIKVFYFNFYMFHSIIIEPNNQLHTNK